MQALLGKIARIEEATSVSSDGDAPAFVPRLNITFKPACVLPQRNGVPEWLKDASLTVARSVPDPREIGQEGDSIVLSAGESQTYLYPLSVAPAVSRTEIPPTLALRLAWWKDENPPEITVRCNGRQQTIKWTKADTAPPANVPFTYTASIETAPFFTFSPTLPVRFEITSGPLKTSAAVLPSAETHFRPVPAADSNSGGERYRAENTFLAVEIDARANAGGVASLIEKGRNLDHFGAPSGDRIMMPLERAGHQDQLRSGWEQITKVWEASLSCADSRHSGAEAARLTLAGQIEEGLRTTVAYTLFKDLPLLLSEREYHFDKKEEKKDGDKEAKPKEPVDDIRSIAPIFRAAFAVERGPGGGSRVLCSDGEELVTKRLSQVGEYFRANGWRLADGWGLIEHPERRAYTLYLMETGNHAPFLALWMGEQTLAFEPEWEQRPVQPGASLGVTLALCAGEIAGASRDGAWVAIRTPLPSGGVGCALVATLKGAAAEGSPVAAFRLGERTRAVPLERLLLPGVGRVYVASAAFEEATLQDTEWDVTAAGIASRRPHH